MRTSRSAGLFVAAWMAAEGVAQADAILLLKDYYVATAQVTTCSSGDCLSGPSEILDVATRTQEGSIVGNSGINPFRLQTEGVGNSFPTASTFLRESDLAPNTWEAGVMAGALDQTPLTYNWLGTTFKSYWEFVVAGDDVSLFSAIAFESGISPAQLILRDLSLDTTVFAFSAQWPDASWWNAWTPLADGHRYSLAASIAARASGDPDTRLHVGSNADVVPAPVPEPTTMLLFGTGAAAMALRKRCVRKRQ